MKKILVTGGSGFVGADLIPVLLSRGLDVCAAVRNEDGLRRLPRGARGLIVGDLCRVSDWRPIVGDAEAVVHLAARVHRMREDASDPAAAYRSANADVTRSLAEAASRAGVQRFIFLSSVKAMGEATPIGGSWNEMSACDPQDDYGRSKLGAESAVKAVAAGGGLEVVILRLPLVYGPGVKANMARLFRTVARGIPLPFGAVKNSRSLLYSGNLSDAIALSLMHPEAAGKTFLLSDGEDLSTPELIRRIGTALGRPARLLPVPPKALRFAAGLVGKSAEIERLLSSLTLDSTKIEKTLRWQRPFTVDDGLRNTAEWFRTHEAIF